jgi:carbonic anhydrase/acetyltransferase-like protein (isoleucine patch superfamily)
MIFSNAGKKPKIHSSAYVAPTATVSGDVTIGPGTAILHGAIVTAEGAPVSIGSDCVVMENAVVKASGGGAMQFPVKIADACIVGPSAYVVGATIGKGCFVASGARVFNNAVMEDGSGVALGGIVHVNAHLVKNSSVPMQHIAVGNPARIFPPEKATEAARDLEFYENVFNIPSGDGAREKAARAYSHFLRKQHGKDSPLDAHENVAPGARRRESDDLKAPVEADTVVDVMMLELQEMEARRREALKNKPKR